MNFNKVIIMTDLDGTLLDDKKQVSKKDLSAIDDFRKNGGLFTVATGRGVAMARRVVDSLNIDIPCVIFNGAAVYDFRKNEFLWQSSMPHCAVDYIKTLMTDFPDIGIEILRGDKVYVVSNNETVEEHMAIESVVPIMAQLDDVPTDGWLKVLIAFSPERLDSVEEYTKTACNKDVNWVRSSPLYYEMLPEGISKGYGYKKLLETIGEENRFTVASGDFGNDLDMVKAADLGVAVANAQPYIKDAARLIVGDNNSSPMSQIIEYIKNM